MEVTGVVEVRSEKNGRLIVDVSYGDQVRELSLDRETFLDWEQFRLALEEAGMRSVVVPATRVTTTNDLRGSWEDWKSAIEGE